MRKRALLAGLILCVAVATGVALWAGQNDAGGPAPAAQIESHVQAFLREYYAWGSQFDVKAGAPKPSPIPGLYEVPVAVSYRGQTDNALVYVTHDGHYLIRGDISSLLGNPYAANIQKLDTENHPFAGPAKACVNVVEFSDFECPHCQAAYQALQTIEPKYPQVRFTFMDFPLTQIHPWAMQAALTARCAYQEKPSAYLQLQKLIFENQDKITEQNATAQLAGFAAQAGLNASALKACVASPATKKLVHDDMALGGELHVNETPTLFVNGRPIVGENGPLLEQFISYEMEKCQAPH
jgi:protein-disulfide isomerase